MKRHELLVVVLLLLPLGCRVTQTAGIAGHGNHGDHQHEVAVESLPAETIGQPVSVADLTQIGLERNPRIHEAQYKIEAIRQQIPQALSLPDPMVNTTTHLSPVQTAAGEQDFAMGISQKFTNGDRRMTRAAIVADELAAAEADLERVQNEVAESIRKASYQLIFVRKAIVITGEDLQTLEQISEVIQRQYEVRKSVTQQDVLNIQVEQAKIENEMTRLQQNEKSYQARLARLLHIDPNSQLQITDEDTTIVDVLDVDALIARAIQSRPELESQLANIHRDQNRIHLARLAEKPDFTVGLNWIATSTDGISPVADGDDALLLGIGFNLPIYRDRIRAGINEARANQRVSESKFASLQDQAAEEVFDLVAKLESARDMLELIREHIIPKAQRTLDLSLEEYVTDNTSYVQLVANWRSVLRYRISEARLQSEYSQFLASLARSVGQLAPITAESTEQDDYYEDTPSPIEPAQGDTEQP